MEFSNFNEHIILQPHNCLDSQAGNLLQQQLAEILPDRHKLWVIDMGDVDFIDSSGLCALVGGLGRRPPPGMSPRHLQPLSHSQANI